mmetsp:Transcript_24072/g.58934  ORF Transcript_24072/g.58934 Transcript_24072/m.58934 type:complete len:93 (-) Transcript_24072:473-751(-)
MMELWMAVSTTRSFDSETMKTVIVNGLDVDPISVVNASGMESHWKTFALKPADSVSRFYQMEGLPRGKSLFLHMHTRNEILYCLGNAAIIEQ